MSSKCIDEMKNIKYSLSDINNKESQSIYYGGILWKKLLCFHWLDLNVIGLSLSLFSNTIFDYNVVNLLFGE